MQGDGHHRIGRTTQLFFTGYAPNIILVGGADNRSYGSYPSRELLALLIEEGVPREAVVFEESGPHTWAEAMRAIEIAQQRNWRKLLLVSSPHHIFRVYLTFVAALREQKAELIFIRGSRFGSALVHTYRVGNSRGPSGSGIRANR